MEKDKVKQYKLTITMTTSMHWSDRELEEIKYSLEEWRVENIQIKQEELKEG